MGMTRAQKEAEVTVLNDRFANDELVVVAQYSGLTVHELEELRGELYDRLETWTRCCVDVLEEL